MLHGFPLKITRDTHNFLQVNETVGGVEGFDLEVVTLAEIMDVTTTKICPKFTLSEEFCDILMGKMTPLLFPYLFPHLDSAIYVDRSIKFQARKTRKEIPEKKNKILEMHCAKQTILRRFLLSQT